MNNKKKNPPQKPHHAPSEKKNWWNTPSVNMAIHVVSTTFVFLVIATAAYGLDSYVHWLEERQASEFMVQALKIFEKAILVVDVTWAMFNIIHGIYKEYFDE
jgi:uncharacterized membrane protein